MNPSLIRPQNQPQVNDHRLKLIASLVSFYPKQTITRKNKLERDFQHPSH